MLFIRQDEFIKVFGYVRKLVRFVLVNVRVLALQHVFPAWFNESHARPLHLESISAQGRQTADFFFS